jgi:hypothetical protein
LSDHPQKPEPSSAALNSVPAIVTFWLLGIWTVMVIGVFLMAAFGVKIEGTTLGVLAGVIGTQTTMLVAAVSFWVGTNIGAKAAGDKMAESMMKGQAAFAQLAGAGPPPPSPPLAPDPTSTPAGPDLGPRPGDSPHEPQSRR